MSEFLDVVTEFEAKYEERFPGALVFNPPATPAQIRQAQEILQAPFPDEVIEYYELHNGTDPYCRMPMRHLHVPLPPYPQGTMNWAAIPGSCGPFDGWHALTVFGSDTFRVSMPLMGEHRGQLYRSTMDDVDVAGINCRAALSLTDWFRSWLYFLDHDYFARAEGHLDVRLARTGYMEVDGPRDAWEVLREAWPHANPVTLTIEYMFEPHNLEFFRQLQTESGITDHHVLDAFEVWDRLMAEVEIRPELDRRFMEPPPD